MKFNDILSEIRSQFPALQRKIDGQAAVYFDGPAGTQVPQRVIDAVSHYLSNCNANHCGLFATSYESDQMLDAAHQACADFVGTADPGEGLAGAGRVVAQGLEARAGLRPGLLQLGSWRREHRLAVTRDTDPVLAVQHADHRAVFGKAILLEDLQHLVGIRVTYLHNRPQLLAEQG